LGVCDKSNFLFLQWANLIGPLQKKVEIMEAPLNKRFYGKMECLLLWPTYTSEKGRTLGKHMGLKPGVIGNNLGEHIGNLRNILWTWWELIRNLKGTYWEQRKNEKNPPFLRNLKDEKSMHFECMWSLPIGCMKFLLPTLFVIIFGLG
jgi:hypothetical protein